MRPFFHLGMILVSLAAGCGLQRDETARVTVDLGSFTSPQKLSALPSDLGRVTLSITGNAMTPITEVLDPPFSEEVQFQVDVPMGADRVFTIEAGVLDKPKIGYRGITTKDIVEGDNSVPIDLQFVNFAADTEGEVSAPSSPDIKSVEILFKTHDTPDISDDEAELMIGFTGDVTPIPLALFIEFDVDNDPDTGTAQTLINKLVDGTGIGTSFLSGSHFTMVMQSGGSLNAPFTLQLYDGQGNKVAVSPKFVLSTSGGFADTQSVFLRFSQEAFTTVIDKDSVGAVCILAGQTASHSPLSPPFSDFSPSDVILGIQTFGAVRYDNVFDTSD